MAIFTVSDRYDFCIFFDPGRFYAHDKVNVSRTREKACFTVKGYKEQTENIADSSTRVESRSSLLSK